MSNLSPSLLEALIPLAAGIFVTIVGFSARFTGPRWLPVKKLRYLGPLLVAFSLFLVIEPQTDPDTAPDVETIAAEIEARLGVPLMVDAETRLDKVEAASDQSLSFEYTLVNLSQDSPELEEVVDALRRMIDDSACSNQDWQTFLRAGVGISVRYLTREGDEALFVQVRPETCGL